jgi:hydrogenase maturation factor
LLLGPGVGLDCAVLEFGEDLLVLKTDPITFATDMIGWYGVQVCANDIATSGGLPQWMMVSLLMPEDRTTPELIEDIFIQLNTACTEIGVTIVGGHTEITNGLDRPILVGTMIGTVQRDKLVTPQGAKPRDHILLTKGVPIEATAILAREFPDRLLEGKQPNSNNRSTNRSVSISPEELIEAQNFIYSPGISVLQDAQIAVKAGKVHAMHDPTEGGLYTALWEMAEACNCSISVDISKVSIHPISERVCQIFDLDPFGSIASGALLLCTPPTEVAKIINDFENEKILCVEIGKILESSEAPEVLESNLPGRSIPRPDRDEIAKVF